MKRILLPAAVLLTIAAPMQSASAAEKCPRGSQMHQSCIDHIYNMENIGEKLAQCFKDLNAEYHGETGYGAGKGSRYIQKKGQCRQLASDALDDIDDAYIPGGDTSVKRTLKQAVKNWQAQAADAAAE